MKKNKQPTKAEKTLQKYFTSIKAFLLMTPVLGYFYVSMQATAMSITFREVLEKMPSVTIIFLLAMMNAYIAYLLHLTQKKLREGEYRFVCSNFVLLLIAEALTANLLYFLMLAYLFYKVVKVHHIPVKQTIKEITISKWFAFGGGSFMVIALSTLCLFVTLRLQ